MAILCGVAAGLVTWAAVDKTLIEIDGGVNEETIADISAAGVDVFVANELVWVGENERRAASDYNHGRDLHTGEIRKTFDHADAWPT